MSNIKYLLSEALTVISTIHDVGRKQGEITIQEYICTMYYPRYLLTKFDCNKFVDNNMYVYMLITNGKIQYTGQKKIRDHTQCPSPTKGKRDSLHILFLPIQRQGKHACPKQKTEPYLI